MVGVVDGVVELAVVLGVIDGGVVVSHLHEVER